MGSIRCHYWTEGESRGAIGTDDEMPQAPSGVGNGTNGVGIFLSPAD